VLNIVECISLSFVEQSCSFLHHMYSLKCSLKWLFTVWNYFSGCRDISITKCWPTFCTYLIWTKANMFYRENFLEYFFSNWTNRTYYQYDNTIIKEYITVEKIGKGFTLNSTHCTFPLKLVRTYDDFRRQRLSCRDRFIQTYFVLISLYSMLFDAYLFLN